MSMIDSEFLASRLDIFPEEVRKDGTIYRMNFDDSIKESRDFEKAFERRSRRNAEKAGTEMPTLPDGVNIHVWVDRVNGFMPAVNDIIKIDAEFWLIESIDKQMMSTRWRCECTSTEDPASL